MQINYRFILLAAILCLPINRLQALDKAPLTIMIDPAGDSKTPGRTIGDSFERSVTFDLALALKKELDALGYATIITRTAGQTIQPLQNANFANRLKPDLYLNLNCYANPDEKFSISLFIMSRAEPFVATIPDLSLLAINKAHLAHQSDTKKISQQFYQKLSQSYAHQFIINPVRAIPVASLVGITAAALSIEINCHTSSDSTQYIQPLIDAIKTALPA